ncbi:MAG TPA: FTR1 family protein [Candidatus Margulisiibacteriota bacterium]|nr:FTR1 family protein [Candidatus Margulisiibacteriota bacterium]
MLAGRCATALLVFVAAARVQAAPSPATEEEVQRLLTLLSAVGEEYREGVRDGTVLRPLEYEEATTFLQDAQQRFATVAAAMPGERVDLTPLFADAATALGQKRSEDQVAARLTALRQRIVAVTGVAEKVYPPAAPSVESGKALFKEYCVACHGERGDGKGPSAAALNPPPANFTDAPFIRGETPYDFFHVISLGKSHTAMPAWGEVLSVQERWDLVSYLWTLAPGAAGIAEGQGVYLTQCASCHGATGNGQGTFANLLVSGARDLSTPQALARKPDAELFAATTTGIGGTPMPSFAHTLTDDDRWKAVAFLRLLSHGGPGHTASGGTSGEGDAAKRFSGLLRLLGSTYERAWSDGHITNAAEYNEASVLAQQMAGAADTLAAQIADASGGTQLQAAARALDSQVRERAARAAVSASIARLDALIEEHAQQWRAAGGDGARAAVTPNAVDTTLSESARLLDTALAAYARGESQATALAGDAYLQFEPLEPHLGAVDPGLKGGIEERFLRLRQALRTAGNEADVKRLANALDADFTAVRAALQPHTSHSALFMQSATIILREGFEVVLVIGALLAYVVKAGSPAMQRPVLAGTAVGIVASLATAAALQEVLRSYPSSSDVLEGITMLLAAAVLFFVSYWLVSKSEADKWQRYIRGKVHHALSNGRSVALASAAFLAVYREGFETVLFYQALYGSAPAASMTITGGFVAGTVALIIVTVLFRRFQVRIPIRQFFFATGLLLYVMAAIFAGQGVHELQDAGIVAVTPLNGVPTIEVLGIYPTAQSLALQAVLVVLLVYATAVTLQASRRGAAAGEGGEILAEVRALRAALDALCGEIRVRPSVTSGMQGERLQALLLRAEQLVGDLQPKAPANGRRNGH